MEVMFREEIMEKCLGCSKIYTGLETGLLHCKTYLFPSAKWRSGNCPAATHLQKDVPEEKKVNPLKASKRGVR